jgi:hypothetical protein
MIFSGPTTKSLLIPGWGEISMGQNSRGQKLLGADVLLWLTLFHGKNLHLQYESDYRAFATEHAGVDWTHADYLYAVDISYHDDLQTFNAEKARSRSVEIELAANGDLIREYGHAMYPENGDFHWQWDSSTHRKEYNDLRIASGNWNKYANFAIAGLIVNRVISVVDVIYLHRTGNKTAINSEVIGSPNNVQLKLNIPF